MSYTYPFPMQSVTADIAIFHRDESSKYDILLTPMVRHSLLLIKRNTEPFKGMYALPGGFLDEEDSDTEEAAHRELKEEVGIDYDSDNVLSSGFIGFYSDKDRDPRPNRVCTAAYYYVVSELPEVSINEDEVQVVEWVNLTDIIEDRINLAFDHKKIIMEAISKMFRKRYGGTTFHESKDQFIRALEMEHDMKTKCDAIADIFGGPYTEPLA